MPLFVSIVLDGVGIGEQPDADQYGDEGSHTLGHVCAVAKPNLPHLTALGLGCITPLAGVPPVDVPRASYGKMREVSAGKDSTTGHWELAGLRLEQPFPTYPMGFPNDVVAAFLAKAGMAAILGNKPASGTAIVDELGITHQDTGHPIVYTSADSVFQIAAHVETIPLEEQYRLCRIARDEVCIGDHAVGRVIARPFAGDRGVYARISAKRKDFALPPPAPTIQIILQQHGVTTISVGKISDLFAHLGFDAAHKTKSNAKGIETTLALIKAHHPDDAVFIWVNLVDFDQDYGHRNNPHGFARALEAFDEALPAFLAALPADARLFITADHGNDPTTPSTDHSREYVPVLFVDSAQDIGRNLGTRATFADHAATIAAYFGVENPGEGTAFNV